MAVDRLTPLADHIALAAARLAFWEVVASGGRGSLRSLRLYDRRLSGIFVRVGPFGFAAAGEAQIRAIRRRATTNRGVLSCP